jgi:hypothetical protein
VVALVLLRSTRIPERVIAADPDAWHRGEPAAMGEASRIDEHHVRLVLAGRSHQPHVVPRDVSPNSNPGVAIGVIDQSRTVSPLDPAYGMYGDPHRNRQLAGRADPETSTGNGQLRVGRLRLEPALRDRRRLGGWPRPGEEPRSSAL